MQGTGADPPPGRRRHARTSRGRVLDRPAPDLGQALTPQQHPVGVRDGHDVGPASSATAVRAPRSSGSTWCSCEISRRCPNCGASRCRGGSQRSGSTPCARTRCHEAATSRRGSTGGRPPKSRASWGRARRRTCVPGRIAQTTSSTGVPPPRTVTADRDRHHYAAGQDSWRATGAWGGCPEQIRVVALAGADDLPVGGHHLHAGHVVHRPAAPPRRIADAAAQGEPSQPHGHMTRPGRVDRTPYPSRLLRWLSGSAPGPRGT